MYIFKRIIIIFGFMFITSCAAQSNNGNADNLNEVYYSTSTAVNAPHGLDYNSDDFKIFSDDTVSYAFHMPYKHEDKNFTRTQAGSYEQIMTFLKGSDFYAMSDTCKQIGSHTVFTGAGVLFGSGEIIGIVSNGNTLSLAPKCAEYSSDPDQFMTKYNAIRDKIIEIVGEK